MATKAFTTYESIAIPDVYTILGIRLKPLTLGHCILMKKYGLPWISDQPEEPSVEALLLGVAICSQNYEEFGEWMKEKNWWEKKPFFNRIVKQLTKYDRPASWRWCQKYYLMKWENDIIKLVDEVLKQAGNDFNVMEKIVLFQQYMQSNLINPHYWEEKDCDNESGGSIFHGILVTLTGQLGYSRTEALNCPFSTALFDYLKLAEQNGLIRLFTEEEEQMEVESK